MSDTRSMEQTEAYENGRCAALDNLPHECPEQLLADKAAWERGWDDGQYVWQTWKAAHA